MPGIYWLVFKVLLFYELNIFQNDNWLIFLENEKSTKSTIWVDLPKILKPKWQPASMIFHTVN